MLISKSNITTAQFLTPTTITAATTTYAGVNLRDYIGNVVLLLSWTRPNAGTGTFAVNILDSADNTTFASNTSAAIADVGTATSGLTSVNIDTRQVNKFVQVQTVCTGATATYTASLVGVGTKQVL